MCQHSGHLFKTVILMCQHSGHLFKTLEITTRYGILCCSPQCFATAHRRFGTCYDELKSIWKEAVTTEALSCICLDGLTKTTEHLTMTGFAPGAVKTGHVTDTLGH